MNPQRESVRGWAYASRESNPDRASQPRPTYAHVMSAMNLCSLLLRNGGLGRSRTDILRIFSPALHPRFSFQPRVV